MLNKIFVFFGFLALASPPLFCQLFTVPNSDKYVEGDLVTPRGRRIVFLVRDGTMLTVRDDYTGAWYGFSLIIVKQGASVMVFEISEIAAGGQRVQQISGGSTVLEEGSTLAVLAKNDKFTIGLRKIGEARFQSRFLILGERSGKSPAELQKMYGTPGGGGCCIICGELTSCGTAIEMDCGTCGTGMRLMR